MRNIIRMGKPFVPFSIDFANDHQDGLLKIKNFREKQIKIRNEKKAKKIYTQDEIEKFCQEIVEKIKNIDWDSNLNNQTSQLSEEDNYGLSPDNPLELIYESISLLKMDLEHAMKDRGEIERKLFLTNKLTTLGEVSAGVGHEINNPLTIMLGFCSNLLAKIQTCPEKLSHAEIKENLEKIGSAGQRIKQIVSSLKMHSRNASDKNSWFSLEHSIKETINLSNILFTNSRIQFEFLPLLKDDDEKKEEAEHFIFGDKMKFQQVLFNIFSNSKDAILDAAKEWGHIKVEIQEKPHLQKMISISIHDDGIGIPEEKIHRIFDAFFTTKAMGRGTGLGLSIAHSVISEMKGNIEVSSIQNEGTTIRIQIPYEAQMESKMHNEEVINK